MKNSYDYWIEKWQKSKNFRVESDRIKTKSYLFSSFPKTNTYGFQRGNIRPLLVGDFYSRYLRMAGENVLFPTGYDSLCFTSYLENKKHSNTINDEISNLFREQMLRLGIGIDTFKEIDLKHNDYLSALQLAFIELYEKGYIQYGKSLVYQNKQKTKIYDAYYKIPDLTITEQDVFSLNIQSITSELITKIQGLPTNDNVKEELLTMLMPKESLTIPFLVTNGNRISITLKEPQYMGGISFIFIHPDYIDFSQYTIYEEHIAIERYLSDDNTNDFGVFTGTYAVNPLTGRKIPIFVSVKYDVDIYVANPYLDSTARMLAKEEGLPIIDVIQNGVFIESDFLNGLPEEEGKDFLIKNFVEASVASVNQYYSRETILLSSLDTYGALIPFLKDNDGKIYSLKKYLPLVFSSKFRPILSEDIDVPGSLITGSINHLFSTGMLPILAMLYDDIGDSISIFSKEALKTFSMWKGIEVMAIEKNELFEYVFVPLCIMTIIEKETEKKLAPFYKNLILISETFDDNYKLIKRANNNLLDLNHYLTQYGGDALRIYFLSKPLFEDFIFVEAELASLANLLKAIEDFFSKPFSIEPSLDMKEIVTNCNTLLKQKEIWRYIDYLVETYKRKLWNSNLTKKQALIFLKLLYPVVPFLVEDIYKETFKGRYLISDDGWAY